MCGDRITVTNKFKFIWLNDKPDKAEDWADGFQGTLLTETVEADLEVVPVNEHLLLAGLNDLVERWATNPPDLIMMDHDFSNVATRPFNLQGSALAHLLRIRLPKVPTVCVSGQRIQSDDFSIEDISEYTDMFETTSLSNVDSMERLFAIAKDFPKICFPPQSPVRLALIETLKAPIADKESLLRILPEEFESAFVHGGSPHRIACWILGVLMRCPGFLYDELEAATFLGLTVTAFHEKAVNFFETALYQGPFATDTRPLWWVSAMTDALYTALPETTAATSQLAGRQLPGIVEADYSVCASTGSTSPPPDVVAYLDEANKERRAVSRRYTELASPDTSARLGFPGRLRIRNDRRETA